MTQQPLPKNAAATQKAYLTFGLTNEIGVFHRFNAALYKVT